MNLPPLLRFSPILPSSTKLPQNLPNHQIKSYLYWHFVNVEEVPVLGQNALFIPCTKLFQKKLWEATGAKQQLVSHFFGNSRLNSQNRTIPPQHHPTLNSSFYDQTFPHFWVALARFLLSQFAKCDVNSAQNVTSKAQNSMKIVNVTCLSSSNSLWEKRLKGFLGNPKTDRCDVKNWNKLNIWKGSLRKLV